MSYTDDDCSICRETFQASDDKTFLTCSHVYHTHCINEWLVRRNTCPICRERIGDGNKENSGNDSENDENGEQEFVERIDGVRVPRYRGGFRFHPNLNEYISPEEGVMMYIIGKMFYVWIIYVIGSSVWYSCSHGWRIIFPDSVEFTSFSPTLEVINGGKCIRNSGFNFWNDRLQDLNGVAGSVPVRFLGSLDIEVEIQYSITKDIEIGDIILEIGFVPTQYVDKGRFIYDQGLAITAIARENNEVRLVISYFGTSMKEERLSGRKKGTTFVGKLILRKLKQNISVHLKVDKSEGMYRETQARYYSTDLPNLPPPEGVYIHTFDNINNLEDVWPVFNACNGSSANVVLSSKHFHEPSCNKNLYISENGQSVSNAKQDGFMKCGLKSRRMESETTTFARSSRELYSYNPFLLHNEYNISFELEFAKSHHSDKEQDLPFQIRIESPGNRFVMAVGALENRIVVYMLSEHSAPNPERIPLRSSHGLKKLRFSIAVNYDLRTIKLDILYPAENNRYSHEFTNMVYTEMPHLYVLMTNTGIMEACFN